MECTTEWKNRQWRWGAVVHTVAVLGLVVLAVMSIRVEEVGGWVACPPQAMRRVGGRGHREESHGGGFAWRVGWAWMRRNGMVALARSEALMVLVSLTEHQGWGWVSLLPWVTWLWKGLGVGY